MISVSARVHWLGKGLLEVGVMGVTNDLLRANAVVSEGLSWHVSGGCWVYGCKCGGPWWFIGRLTIRKSWTSGTLPPTHLVHRAILPDTAPVFPGCSI